MAGRVLMILAALCLCTSGPVEVRAADTVPPAQSPVEPWDALLRSHDFPDTAIVEDNTVIALSAPYRAEDAAMTPVRITAQFAQTPARYIETIHLYVDHNPEPRAGVFHFTPASGRADLALRLRIDRYTHVRAIAVLNTGEHHMASAFVKAQGGCAIPVAIDYNKAMAGLGHMQLRAQGASADEDIAAQLRVRHPNFTGMQMDFRIYAVRPAHYVKTIRVSLNGTPVMSAETGISISEDPSFRFFLAAGASGRLEADITDSKGEHWVQAIDL